jgi:hypothetical protein
MSNSLTNEIQECFTNPIRNRILDSLTEVRNKNDNTLIPITTKTLKFESSMYSSTKENIWHVFINGNKIKKSSEYTYTYICLTCKKPNTCASTQFLRKIRQGKAQCFQCNNIALNSLPENKLRKDYPKTKPVEKSYRQKHEDSKTEFETYPDQYKNSYLLSHLSQEDYNRILPKIQSFGSGKYTDLNDYEYWPVYKVNNQMKFSHVLYNPMNDTIFKADQPILKCDSCEGVWRAKTIDQFKNDHKILCKDCTLCNRTFKLRPMKNINNQIIMYQSKLELKFIEWCAAQNILVTNGPNIEYVFNEKSHKYKVDFKVGNCLVEIKDFHIWHRNQVESGKWQAKEDAAEKYIKDSELSRYYFITPKNWNQMIRELSNELEKEIKTK